MTDTTFVQLTIGTWFALCLALGIIAIPFERRRRKRRRP